MRISPLVFQISEMQNTMAQIRMGTWAMGEGNGDRESGRFADPIS